MTIQYGRITTGHDVIYPRYNPENFIGRKWLIQKVKAFRDDPDGRHLFIVGEPGSGKSTFMAYLAVTWDCPLHFIRVDNIGGVTGVDPRSFLISIGSQLYQKYGPDIFPKGASGTTKVTTGFTKDKAEVVGRFIDVLYTLPFLPPTKRDVAVKAAVTTGESKVIGERIRKMVDVTHALDEKTLLHVAVINPVQKVKELYPEERVVILIDALDESLQHPGTQVVDIIPRVADADFPDNLRLVMTTRPGDHLVPFREKDQLKLDDKVYRAKSLQDTRDYIDKYLAKEPLATAIADWSTEEKEAYIKEIQTNSDGNFLYLYYFFNELFDAVERGESELQKIGAPKELDEIYQVFAVDKIRDNVSDSIHFTVVGEISTDLKSQWEGMFGVKQVKVIDQQVMITMTDVNLVLGPLYSLAPTVGVQIINPQIQQGAAGGAWEEKYLPILAILAVAYDALNRKQLAGYAKVDVKYVDTIVAQLKQFLDTVSDEDENYYRIYHNSFAEYLLDDSRNRDYPLNGPTYHYQVASFYRGDYDDWSKVKWDDVQEMYVFRHLSNHLVAAKRNNELYQLIDRSWMNAKYKRFYSHRAFTDDVWLAIFAAIDDLSPQGLVQLVRGGLILTTVNTVTTNAPPEFWGALAQVGHVDQAIGYADFISSEDERSTTYYLIGNALLKQAEFKKAQAILQMAKKTAEQVMDEDKKATCLSQAIQTLAEVQVHLDEGQTLTRLLLEANQIEKPRQRIAAWLALSQAFRQTGDNESAFDTASLSLKDTTMASDHDVYNSQLGQAAALLIELGEFDPILQTKATILADHDGQDYATLVCLVPSLIDIGDLEGVNDILEAIQGVQESNSRSKFLTQMVHSIGKADQSKLIRNVLELIKATGITTEAPSEIAINLVNCGDKVGLRLVLEITLAINEYENRISTLDLVIEALALANDSEGIELVLEMIEDRVEQRERVIGRAWVGRALARGGRKKHASQILKKVLEVAKVVDWGMHTDDLMRTLNVVAEALDIIGDRSGAGAVVDDMLSISNSPKNDFGWRSHFLGITLQRLVSMGKIEVIPKVALDALSLLLHYGIDHERDKGDIYVVNVKTPQQIILCEIVQAIVYAGDRENLKQAIMLAKSIRNYLRRFDVCNDIVKIIAKASTKHRIELALVALQEFTPDDRAYNTLLSQIAPQLADDGDVEGMKHLLAILGRLRQDQDMGKSEVLQSVALELSQASHFERAWEVSQSIWQKSNEATVMCRLAQDLVQAGERKRASELAHQAIQMLPNISIWDQMEILTEAARVFVDLNDVESAERIATLVGELNYEFFKWETGTSLRKTAEILAEVIDHQRVVSLRKADPTSRPFILAGVARCLAKAGSNNLAQELAQQAADASNEVPAMYDYVSAKSEAAQALALSGSRDAAREAAHRAFANVWKAEHIEDRAVALGKAAHALALAGDREKLTEALEQAIWFQYYEQNLSLANVSSALAEVGDIPGLHKALDDAFKIGSLGKAFLSQKCEAIAGVTWAMAKAGDRQGLIEALGKIKTDDDVNEKFKAEYRACVFSALANPLTHSGQPDQALQPLRQAFTAACYTHRERVFKTLANGVSTLAAIDGGETLWLAFQAVQNVDAWWGGDRK